MNTVLGWTLQGPARQIASPEVTTRIMVCVLQTNSAVTVETESEETIYSLEKQPRNLTNGSGSDPLMKEKSSAENSKIVPA